MVPQLACFFLASIRAQDVLLRLAAIAASGHPLITTSAQAFVTRSVVGVLATRHDLTTNLSAAPTIVVIGV